MPLVAPLVERQERYDRIRAMKDSGKTLDQIGRSFGLTRARVAQILDKPPRKPGPPFKAATMEVLRARLSTWEKRREARIEKGLNTIIADERIAVLLREIAMYREAIGRQ